MKYSNCKIFLMDGDRNEATSAYIDILQNAFSKIFGEVKCTSNLKEIAKDDLVIVIAIYSIIKLIKNRFNQPFIYWYQGVPPEEIGYGLKKIGIRTRVKKGYFAFWEWLALHKSKFNFFVSVAMHDHYKKKYLYTKDNYFVMPCFNTDIEEDAFKTEDKYSQLTFVYAGGILAWQCVEESIILFKRIKERYNNARFTILTGQKEEAFKLINKHKVKDVEVKYVPLNELQAELSKYKYGFLLRQDDTVNNVATPTKFNSYLACGVIPIISEVIGDFNKVTQNMQYIIKAKDNNDLENTYHKIVLMEQKMIDPQKILFEYKHLFERYYNADAYIKEIYDKVIKYV